ncbi:MAG: hypothetical protein WDZ94_04975 [Patescibacteria group bacterium]
MNKKMIIIVLSVLIGISALAAGAYWFLTGSNDQLAEDEAPTKRRIEEPENVIPVSQRPVISVRPEADGRHVIISIEAVKKPATEAEYILEYQTGTLVQAQQGLISIPSAPVTERILMGSCSAGGACTYHEDIQGGPLRTRFDGGGGEAYALQSDWRYFDNADQESAFSSRDVLFQIESDDLASQRYLIIFNGSGYPAGLEEYGEVVSDPYHLNVSGTLSGEGTLTMRAREEGNLKIMGWDGSDWAEFEGEVDGRMITAEVPLLPFYIVVR